VATAMAARVSSMSGRPEPESYALAPHAAENDLREQYTGPSIVDGVYGQPAGGGRRQDSNRSSLAYRRFPALATFTDPELDAITMPKADPDTMRRTKSTGKLESRWGGTDIEPHAVPFSALSSFRASVITKGQGNSKQPNFMAATTGQMTKVRPSTEVHKSGIVRPQGARAAMPFSPINPWQSREAITDWREGYVLMRSPFDAAQVREREERARSVAMRRAGAFLPSSGAKAKTSIRVNYFLNSPDTETLEAEQQYIRELSLRNMDAYRKDQRNKLMHLRERAKQEEELEYEAD